MTKELYHITSIQFAKGVVSGLTVFRGSEPFGYYFEVKADGTITNPKHDDRKDAQEVLTLLKERLNSFVLECNKINIELHELPSRN